ncbi:MAG: hypothetical protein QOJ15_3976 [Bradyrhizobium sp.]|nr:hypothetical protein [Bradyrhizobium sp.]
MIADNLAMSEAKYAAYEALGPFFEIIMKGLSGVVDGDHYFDTIAEDATFEFLYDTNSLDGPEQSGDVPS